MNNKFLHTNGLSVLMDYISFTVTQQMEVDELIEKIGFSPLMFELMPHGSNGYKRMRKHGNHEISVLYDGAENMGIHVNISGSAVGALLSAYEKNISIETPFGDGYEVNYWSETVLSHFIHEFSEIGHFTRLDIAIDDYGCNFYSCDEVIEKFEKRLVVSRFRRYEDRCPNTLSNEKIGQTINVGSRESSIFLRIYDKKLEQNGKLAPDDKRYIHDEWVRWELELKNKRANELAKLLVDGVSLGKIAFGVLSYYFRIIQNDDSNRSRCSNEPKWDAFIDNIEKLRLSVPEKEKTILDSEIWVENQVAPTLAKLVLANDGDVTPLLDMIHKAVPRLKQSDYEAIRKHNPNACCFYETE